MRPTGLWPFVWRRERTTSCCMTLYKTALRLGRGLTSRPTTNYNRYRHTVCMHGADSEVSACFESHHRFIFLFREPLQLDTRHKVTLPARSLFCLALLRGPAEQARERARGWVLCPHRVGLGRVMQTRAGGRSHSTARASTYTACVYSRVPLTSVSRRCMQHTRRRIQWKSPQ